VANSLPSNTITATPLTTSGTPGTRLAAWMDEIRNLFIDSANFLSWIQSVNGAETTADHVILGYSAREVQKSAQTEGPSVFIWPENYLGENRFSARTYLDSFDIIAEIVWFKSHLSSDTFIEEVNFISNIMDEAKAVGTNLSAVHQGEIHTIQSRDLILENPDNRDERRIEIRFSVRAGTEE